MSVLPFTPPVRPGWINRINDPAKKATALLRVYLESRVGCTNATESKSCKTMLITLSNYQKEDNVCGIELGIMRGPGFNSVTLYFHNNVSHGAIVWLPSLITESNDRLKHIIREVGPDCLRLPFGPQDTEPLSILDGPNRSMYAVPAKVETRLIKGKKI